SLADFQSRHANCNGCSARPREQVQMSPAELAEEGDCEWSAELSPSSSTPLTASPPGEKTSASGHHPRNSRTSDRAGDNAEGYVVERNEHGRLGKEGQNVRACTGNRACYRLIWIGAAPIVDEDDIVKRVIRIPGRNENLT